MILNEKDFSSLVKSASAKGWKTSTEDYGDGCISYGFSKTHGVYTNYMFAISQKKGEYEIFDYYYDELNK